jgi:hypothetical protein
LLQVNSLPISLFIQLPGRGTFEVIDTTGPRVGHLKDAVITKFKLLEGFKADQLQLFRLDGNGIVGTLLDSTKTLSEAAVFAGTRLVVEFTPVAGVWQYRCQGD